MYLFCSAILVQPGVPFCSQLSAPPTQSPGPTTGQISRENSPTCPSPPSGTDLNPPPPFSLGVPLCHCPLSHNCLTMDLRTKTMGSGFGSPTFIPPQLGCFHHQYRWSVLTCVQAIPEKHNLGKTTPPKKILVNFQQNAKSTFDPN